ncbi:MAG: alpha/beta hydrolase [Salinarimonadaceae bacterium]|nr:MAG: alpha/beta hydrolase [Salinarimonadaceae bacterium]
MLVDLAACNPPAAVIVIENPDRTEGEGLLTSLLAPLHPLREQFVAVTGLGLDGVDEEGEALLVRRTTSVRNGDEERSLSFLTAGPASGLRVVFVHGSPGGAIEWGPILANAPQGQYRLAPDRPGFGETRPAEPVTSLTGQADAIAPLVRDPRGGKAIVVGYSYGGAVALRSALDMPDQIGGLVLVGSAADPTREEIHPLQTLASLDAFSWMLPSDLGNSNAELLALGPELEALRERLPELRVPVTIVHGLEDNLVSVENVLYLRERLSGSMKVRLILVESGDHFLPWTHPEQIEAAVSCAIEDMKGAGGNER